MPRRRFRLPEVVWNNPFQVGLSLTLLTVGAQSLLSALDQPVILSRTVDGLPHPLTLVFYGVAVLGGALTLAGMMWPRSHLAAGVEQAGLWASASAWGAYAVAVVDRSGTDAALMATALLALSGASLVRALGLAREARARLAAMRLAGRGGTKGDAE